ncbi:hypothetical protein CL617_02730 [archaeon]|nr:hypothetical protein [archaeon]|tara:strand:+ start:8372 stop:8632 length:261 start_codon:yes stop_codon:yes gene_type:complete
MAEIKYVEEDGKKFKVDNDGEKYRISWSEELQLKQLKEQKSTRRLLTMNFYVAIVLGILFLTLVVTMIFTLYRLDQINFFTGLLYR